MTKLVAKLRHLASLHKPENGGPYGGYAADRCVAAMLEAADAIEGGPWTASVHEALKEGGGFWRSCSGCHELNDGAPTGDYSGVFRTHAGMGCRECGGLGVTWDTTDYADMADYLLLADELDDDSSGSGSLPSLNLLREGR